jgi:hypothetical protein
VTTIGCFRIAGIPTLFGDLLISSPKPSAAAVSLPAIGTINTPDSQREYHPVQLQQKVCIISNELVIAWAGAQFIAKSVIKGLRERFANAHVTRDSLFQFFDEYGLLTMTSCQFAGLLLEHGQVTCFGVHTDHHNHSVLGECYVGGSGAAKLLAAAKPRSGPKQVEGMIRDVDDAVNEQLLFATRFLIEEYLAGLQDTYFGGGFEIGAITENGAEKVGYILTLFWRYDPNQNEVPLLEPMMIKWDYIDDDLIVQRLVQARNSSGAFELKEHTVSAIAPPDRTPVFGRPYFPDLNWKYLCSSYYRVDEGNTARTTTSVFRSGKKDGPLRFTREGGQLHMDFDLEHFAKEWEFVRAALR